MFADQYDTLISFSVKQSLTLYVVALFYTFSTPTPNSIGKIALMMKVFIKVKGTARVLKDLTFVSAFVRVQNDRNSR